MRLYGTSTTRITFDMHYTSYLFPCRPQGRLAPKHHVAVLLANYVNAFYMKLCVSGESHVKYTYIIGQEHSHAVLPDHASLSRTAQIGTSKAHNKWC